MWLLDARHDCTWKSNGWSLYRHNKFRKNQYPAGSHQRFCHIFCMVGMGDPGSTNAPQRHQEANGGVVGLRGLAD
jgi:hypothetical protein